MSVDESILLVEDSPSQAIRFSYLLSCKGYHVIHANDGREGWCHACTEHPALILLDINLPLMNGFQVLLRLKRDKSTTDIPVVMLSDNDHADHVERAIDLGADDYLFKEDYAKYDAARRLQEVIEQILSKKSFPCDCDKQSAQSPQKANVHFCPQRNAVALQV